MAEGCVFTACVYGSDGVEFMYCHSDQSNTFQSSSTVAPVQFLTVPTELHPQKWAFHANVHVGLSVGRLAYRQLANKPRQAG